MQGKRFEWSQEGGWCFYCWWVRRKTMMKGFFIAVNPMSSHLLERR